MIEFRLSLNKETDRGVALVCAAYIETELESLLRKTFIDDPRIVGKLFEYPGALGSFSSKIELVFVMGLVEEDIYKSLRSIKKIRNTFAHSHRERRFRDQDIADQCKNLMQVTISTAENNPRKLFVASCMSILAGLYVYIRLAKHAEIAAPIRLEAIS